MKARRPGHWQLASDLPCSSIKYQLFNNTGLQRTAHSAQRRRRIGADTRGLWNSKARVPRGPGGSLALAVAVEVEVRETEV